MLYSFVNFALGLIVRLLTRIEVIDLENVPLKGGYIIAVNHLSILDPVLVFVLVPRKDLTALVAKKHQQNPLFRWVVDSIDGIWLNRDEPDAHAIRAARDHLQRGGILGISPEGTRSLNGALAPAKTGVAYLADIARVPIIPVAITGTFNGIHEALALKRPRVTVRFGKPFSLPAVERNNRDADLKSNTDEIMCRLAAMLPVEYRGVYADYPRVRELNGSKETSPA